MTEAELQAAIIEMAGWLGYRLIYHTKYSIQSTAGFPDLVLVGRGRLIFAEVKSAKGKLTTPQLAWYAGLLDVGAEVYVWRPADWKSGTIERNLKHEDENEEER
jgi:VRR-NUC domain